MEGLKAILALKAATNQELADAFKKAFPDCKYGQTSVKKARNIFWRALEIGGHHLVQRYVDYGHKQEGLWKHFRDYVDGKFYAISLLKLVS